jgi:hypothetical protein
LILPVLVRILEAAMLCCRLDWMNEIVLTMSCTALVHSDQEVAVPYGFVCACFVAWYTVHVAYEVHLPILMVRWICSHSVGKCNE